MTHVLKFSRGFERLVFEQAEKIPEKNAFLPSYAFVPLTQESGECLTPIVALGDSVKESQLLARSFDSTTRHVFSPIPGIVERFLDYPLPNGSVGLVILIRLQGTFSLLGKKEEKYSWKNVPESELVRIFDEKGLINTFEAPKTLAPLVRASKKSGADSLFVRLFDKDPSCVLDSYLFEQHTHKVLEGIGIIAKSLGVKKVYLLYKSKQKDMLDQASFSDFFYNQDVITIKCSDKYPSGFKNQILEKLGITLKKSQPLFIEPHTACFAFDAVVHNTPVLYKYVLFAGPSIAKTTVLKCRIGTPIGDLIEECGGFKRKPVRIVINGILTGHAISNLDTPINETIKSVHLLDNEVCPSYVEHDCIRCGLCFSVCPEYIDPSSTVSAIKSLQLSKKNISDIGKCQQCGCCMIVCPSRIPLHHIIKEASTMHKDSL